MKILSTSSIEHTAGLGTKIKKTIAKVVDASPLSDQAKTAIKNCGGCNQRAKGIDVIDAKARRAIKRARRFISGDTQAKP